MIKKRLTLKFGKETSQKPVVCRLIKDYDIIFNILRGEITPEKEGILELEVTANRYDFDRGINYLKENGIKIELKE